MNGDDSSQQGPLTSVPPGEGEVRGVAYYSESYQGPLPPADELRKYEELAPGTAEKYIDVVIDQIRQRTESERKSSDSIVWLVRRSRYSTHSSRRW